MRSLRTCAFTPLAAIVSQSHQPFKEELRGTCHPLGGQTEGQGHTPFGLFADGASPLVASTLHAISTRVLRWTCLSELPWGWEPLNIIPRGGRLPCPRPPPSGSSSARRSSFGRSYLSEGVNGTTPLPENKRYRETFVPITSVRVHLCLTHTHTVLREKGEGVLRGGGSRGARARCGGFSQSAASPLKLRRKRARIWRTFWLVPTLYGKVLAPAEGLPVEITRFRHTVFGLWFICYFMFACAGGGAGAGGWARYQFCRIYFKIYRRGAPAKILKKFAVGPDFHQDLSHLRCGVGGWVRLGGY